MEVTHSKNNGRHVITITGAIKTIEENQRVKAAMEKALREDSEAEIDIFLRSSDVITSSLIGYLIKLIYGENLKIAVHTDSEKLFELIEKLNLADILNVKKI